MNKLKEILKTIGSLLIAIGVGLFFALIFVMCAVLPFKAPAMNLKAPSVYVTDYVLDSSVKEYQALKGVVTYMADNDLTTRHILSSSLGAIITGGVVYTYVKYRKPVNRAYRLLKKPYKKLRREILKNQARQ